MQKAKEKSFYNFALLGFPVSHTLSPDIQTEFLLKAGLKGAYSVIQTRPEELFEKIRALQTLNFTGANLTVPHKEKVLSVLDQLSPEATLIQAVNTLVFQEKEIIGENTDWQGFLESLPENLRSPADKRAKIKACVIGAGGSAKAVLLGLLETKNLAEETYFLLRKSPRLQKNLESLELIAHKKNKSHRLKFIYFEELSKKRDLKRAEFNLVVNATPLGLAGVNQDLCPIDQDFLDSFCSLATGCYFYDLNYKPRLSKFLELAQKNKQAITNGYRMLKLQAEYAFRIWTGRNIKS